MRKLNLGKWLVSVVTTLGLLCTWQLAHGSASTASASCDVTVVPHIKAIQACGVFGDPDANGILQIAFRADVAFSLSCPDQTANAGYMTPAGDGKAVHYAVISAISIIQHSVDQGSTWINSTDVDLAAASESALAALDNDLINASLNGLVGTAACASGKIGIPINAMHGVAAGDGSLAATSAWINGGQRGALLTTKDDENRYALKYTMGSSTFSAVGGGDDYGDILASGQDIFPAFTLSYNSAGTAVPTTDYVGANALQATITITPLYNAASLDADDGGFVSSVIGGVNTQAW